MGIFDIFVTVIFFSIGLLLVIFSRKIGNAFYMEIPVLVNIFTLIERLLDKMKRSNIRNEFISPGLSVYIWWLRIIGFAFVGLCVFSIIHSMMN
jgi:hypothetical protein